MGPQPVGHGYREMREEEYEEIRRFQWGHNLSVMDTTFRLDTLPNQHPTVSMGPQPVGHGYFGIQLEALSKSDTFQWGHNLSVMDTWNMKYDVKEGTDVSMGPQPVGHGYWATGR